MTAIAWRDGAQELRRLVVAEGDDPDRIQDVDLAWRGFRAFLAVPLDGIFDRWKNDVEADALLVEFDVVEWLDGLPVLLLSPRFDIPSVEWHDGVPGDPAAAQDDLDLDLADTVQIEMELTFPRGTTVEADGFWTAARSGEFSAAELAEAEELVTGLALPAPIGSRIGLTSLN